MEYSSSQIILLLLAGDFSIKIRLYQVCSQWGETQQKNFRFSFGKWNFILKKKEKLAEDQGNLRFSPMCQK